MEVSDFLGENVATLYRHFDEFKTKAMYFMTELPFEVKYELTAAKGRKPLMEIRLVHAPIPIGALFLCWQSNPELFRAPCSTPDKEYLIYSFNGSPLSGANCWSAVCPNTGERITGKNDGNFRMRCACLNDAIIESLKKLEEYKSRKGVDIFTPASLDELVEFVKQFSQKSDTWGMRITRRLTEAGFPPPDNSKIGQSCIRPVPTRHNLTQEVEEIFMKQGITPKWGHKTGSCIMPAPRKIKNDDR